MRIRWNDLEDMDEEFDDDLHLDRVGRLSKFPKNEEVEGMSSGKRKTKRDRDKIRRLKEGQASDLGRQDEKIDPTARD